ncbi:hypothetical protein GCM10009863_64050 [Streptomyces axinellae]|uniref:Transposase n=1 Tax=Streptomyces axinellae TaxID=552788 RepID=A0ABP6DCW4_9ACTN
MGAVGTSPDNALAESFNEVLIRETLQGRPPFRRRPSLPPRSLRLDRALPHPPQAIPPRKAPNEYDRRPAALTLAA